MVLDGAVNAAALIRFLQRLIRDVRRKVFLVLDRLQVHRAGQIRDWLAAHRTKIEVFYLPAYSPELNPDEGLNADLKQAVTRKPPARSKHDLKRCGISHMRRPPNRLPAAEATSATSPSSATPHEPRAREPMGLPKPPPASPPMYSSVRPTAR